MLGVSLDPEISIQSFHDYISIRGVIELHGTYQKETTAVDEAESTADFEDYHSRRYVEKVENIDDGQAEFAHRFPVEISVPANRVTDMDDVTVGIESLDYEIPDQNQLKLDAVIEIQGITDEIEKTDDTEMEAEQAPLPRNEETFDFDIKMKKDDEESEETGYPETAPVLSEGPKLESSQQEPTLETVEETQEPEADKAAEKDRWKGKKTQTLAEFLGRRKRKSRKLTWRGQPNRNMWKRVTMNPRHWQHTRIRTI